MNPHFALEEGWPEYPRVAYARLDDVEPSLDLELETAVLAYDAVDAAAACFQRGAFLSLDPREEGAAWRQAYWRGLFYGEIPPEDPFEKVPIFRIEITLRRSDPLFDRAIRLQDQWVELFLENDGLVPVDVYGGLFAAPVEAYLAKQPEISPNAHLLAEAFDMDTWPDASDSDLDKILQPKCKFDQLAMLDVGQGSAHALMCECGFPVLYSDVGCGVYRNARTRPGTVRFCLCNDPPVVLSHWDADHWSGARQDTELLKKRWVAPRQSITTVHTTFANDILRAGGSIHVVANGAPPRSWNNGSQTLHLSRATGSKRNGTGLVLSVEDRNHGTSWLLPGDAGYADLGTALPPSACAVAVPHHGASMPAKHVPPVPAQGYARALYSFGPDNKHGRTNVTHPVQSTVDAHTAANWQSPGWPPPGPPGTALAGGDTLATAQNTSPHQSGGSQHMKGARAGWTGPPGQPAHYSSCSKNMPIPQD